MPQPVLRVCECASTCTACPQPVLRVCLSLYCTPSPLTAHRHPLLHTLIPYCIPSSRTAHLHPVLHTLIPYCTPSSRTAHPHPVLHTLIPYCTPSSRTAHPHPVLHTISLYCTYFIQGAITYLFPLEFFSRMFPIFQVRGTRSMAVPEIMFSSFCWKSVVRCFLNLLTPVIA